MPITFMFKQYDRCTTFILKQYEPIKNRVCTINILKLLPKKFVMSSNNV